LKSFCLVICHSATSEPQWGQKTRGLQLPFPGGLWGMDPGVSWHLYASAQVNILSQPAHLMLSSFITVYPSFQRIWVWWYTPSAAQYTEPRSSNQSWSKSPPFHCIRLYTKNWDLVNNKGGFWKYWYIKTTLKIWRGQKAGISCQYPGLSFCNNSCDIFFISKSITQDISKRAHHYIMFSASFGLNCRLHNDQYTEYLSRYNCVNRTRRYDSVYIGGF
jgi:hypothetical protein